MAGVEVRGQDGLLGDIHGNNVMLACGGYFTTYMTSKIANDLNFRYRR